MYEDINKRNENKYSTELKQIRTIKENGSSWEKSFMTSIEQIFLNNWTLSAKQQTHYNRLISKYFPSQNKDNGIYQGDFNPMVFGDRDKEKIQRTAFNKWMDKDCLGTLEIGTGVGKTRIGIMAIRQFWPCTVVVVVPKTDLMEQFIGELTQQLGSYSNIVDSIGRIGDGFKEFEKDIRVCIVNSIRDEELNADLLITDELHKYASPRNITFLEKGNFKRILGLTATIKREDGEHTKLLEYAPLIYKYSQREAINEGLLSGFELINVKVNLTDKEDGKLEQYNDFIAMNFPSFGNDFNQVREYVSKGGVLGATARDLMRCFTRRRSVLLNAVNKEDKTVEIILEEKIPKTIVFCEYIKTADSITQKLLDKNIKCGKYHSGMKNNEKEKMLEDFKNDKIKVIVSVKSLDEGTNVPNSEMAIITGGSQVRRQMIQRLGRILRTHPGKDMATVFQLYIPGTKDFIWLKNRTKELTKNAKRVSWK